MGEVGKVVKLNNDKVTVALERKEACAKCRACTAGLKKEEMLIDALNVCNAKIDDKVEVVLEEANFFKAVLIMYGFPLVMLLLGVFGGYYITYSLSYSNPELIAVASGLILTVMSFLIIRLNENKLKKQNYIPKAIKIYNDEI